MRKRLEMVFRRGFLALGLALGLSLAQAEPFQDALHGFGVILPSSYTVRVRDFGLLLGDLEAFLLVRGMPLRTPKEALSPLVQEAQALAGGRGSYYLKEAPGGLLLLGRGLSYLFRLADYMTALSPSARQDPFLLGLTYEVAHLLLPGPKSLLVVSVYLPTDAPREAREKALGVLRSLEFLPPQARVAYRAQTVQDPVLGMEAFTLEVPQGYRLQNGLVPTGASAGAVRQLAYALQGPGVLLRQDLLYARASSLQTGFGGNASTVLGWNGRVGQVAGFLCPTSAQESGQLLANLWSQEEGKAWEVRKVEAGPSLASRVARRLQELRQAEEASMTAGLPFQAQRVRLNLKVQAVSGNLAREAFLEGGVYLFSSPDRIAASSDCDFRARVVLKEGTQRGLDQASPVFNGFLLGVRVQPEWPWLEARRAQQMSDEETRRVLAMIREQENFNTWMRQSWANLLSDQTYVRDPTTGEVFRSYKESFNTGTFWRDPVFGGTVGAVERGGRLEDLLRQGGWRQLEESLSGLPGTWKR
ncbi:hypothetical protein [Meiothermus sp.]|uniref:hypothetical protein n=1 Tax=Meiothermus sp. TaxID=1955249 RepID=UPI0021DD33D7|nr:hypothetical protein [Meiothermus sp.]GIW26623.1 MAG: hypothetical protein KatS3mg069_2890 [Meiothermus sp.]